MLIATTCSEVRAQVAAWKEEGLTVGLVPTMGYLHEGHASLVEEAVRQCDRVVVSDFVNPTQFGPNEDLEAYPRDFRRDCAILEAHGCHLVFHPTVEEMYPPDAATYVEMLSEMPKQLCGKTRPIHFRGVCTVVAKLFNIVTPDKAFFGQKDAQQLAILRRMVRDLSYGITLVGCPIVREPDGLAKSSRNTYLSKEERRAALVLSQAVALGEDLVASGETDARSIVTAMTDHIAAEPLARVDYVSAVDGETMEPVDQIREGVLVALAVYIGKTRITVDQALLEAAGILEYEKVQIVDIDNGSRFETYTIAGERGSGMICLNGAAARCVSVGDKIIIMSYAHMTPEEIARGYHPNVVFVDEENQVARVTAYEKHGLLKDMA